MYYYTSWFGIHMVSPVQNVLLFQIESLLANRFNPILIPWMTMCGSRYSVIQFIITKAIWLSASVIWLGFSPWVCIKYSINGPIYFNILRISIKRHTRRETCVINCMWRWHLNLDPRTTLDINEDESLFIKKSAWPLVINYFNVLLGKVLRDGAFLSRIVLFKTFKHQLLLFCGFICWPNLILKLGILF